VKDDMEWKKIKQPKESVKSYYDSPLFPTDPNNDIRIGGTVHNNHFVTLKRNPRSSENAFYFLNLHARPLSQPFVLSPETQKKTWSSFDIKGIYEHEDEGRPSISDPMTCSLMSYKNLLFTLADRESDENLILAVMDLESIMKSHFRLLIFGFRFGDLYTKVV